MTNDTDTATTTPAADISSIDERPDNPPAFTPTDLGAELERARERERAAIERAVRAEAEAHRLSTEQITDGGDPRLHDFWVNAGDIATRERFCDEYDRLADAIGGLSRERDFSVTIDLKVDVRVYMNLTARTEDDAEQRARDDVDSGAIIAALRDNGHDGIDIYNVDVEQE